MPEAFINICDFKEDFLETWVFFCGYRVRRLEGDEAVLSGPRVWACDGGADGSLSNPERWLDGDPRVWALYPQLCGSPRLYQLPAAEIVCLFGLSHYSTPILRAGPGTSLSFFFFFFGRAVWYVGF